MTSVFLRLRTPFTCNRKRLGSRLLFEITENSVFIKVKNPVVRQPAVKLVEAKLTVVFV